jgi:hypothetical protein
MKLTIEPTGEIIEVCGAHGCFPARIWHGTDEHGTRVEVLITRLAVIDKDSPERVARFEEALLAVDPPRSREPGKGPWPLQFFID